MPHVFACWRNQMEAFSALLALCAENSPVTGEFPSQRPVTRNFHVFFDLRLNKRFSKQPWGCWFETPSCPLWCHSNCVLNLRQAHSSVERAALLGAVKCRKITSDEKEQMRGDALRQAIEQDVADGLVPFFVSTGGKARASYYSPFVKGIHQWPVKGQLRLEQSHPLLYLRYNYSSMLKLQTAVELRPRMSNYAEKYCVDVFT